VINEKSSPPTKKSKNLSRAMIGAAVPNDIDVKDSSSDTEEDDDEDDQYEDEDLLTITTARTKSKEEETGIYDQPQEDLQTNFLDHEN
jgi:hypothetical protein